MTVAAIDSRRPSRRPSRRGGAPNRRRRQCVAAVVLAWPVPRALASTSPGASSAAPSTASSASSSTASRGLIRVAAAADLEPALTEIASRFEAATGHRVRVSFGSSGNFHRQLLQRAPFDLYLSADERYALDLAERGLTEDRGSLYALGRLALYAPRGAPWSPDKGFADLARALREGRIAHFAIANPEHAPYGRAAREALDAAGLWRAIEPRLVLGENVSQAAQFAASGSTQGGLIARSLALLPRLAQAGASAVVPASMHEPLRQRMVLMRGAGDSARALARAILAPAAREHFTRHGFEPPQGP